ncbi:MAG: phytanoyl-CoA dioxygenase family protein [Chitinophagales bacterium]|nr:phytanoyl-CoA dioxygenase family protein [Chitinophagales bacterium]
MKNEIFHLKQHAEDFQRDGYIVVNLLTDQEIDFLLEKYNLIEKKSLNGVTQNRYNTLEIEDYNYRSSVYHHLSPFLAERIKKFVKGYQIIGINFAVKKPFGEEFPPHVDDSHTDSELLGINVWIPLTDVTPQNGGLYMFKGTHQINIPMRGIGLPFPYPQHLETIRKYARPLSLKLGQAIIFNDKIIHGSGKNNSQVERPAIITGMIPEDATAKVFVSYDSIGNNKAELFEISTDFFLTFSFKGRPNGFKSLGIFDYIPPQIDDKSFQELITSS